MKLWDFDIRDYDIDRRKLEVSIRGAVVYAILCFLNTFVFTTPVFFIATVFPFLVVLAYVIIFEPRYDELPRNSWLAPVGLTGVGHGYRGGVYIFGHGLRHALDGYVSTKAWCFKAYGAKTAPTAKWGYHDAQQPAWVVSFYWMPYRQIHVNILEHAKWLRTRLLVDNPKGIWRTLAEWFGVRRVELVTAVDPQLWGDVSKGRGLNPKELWDASDRTIPDCLYDFATVHTSRWLLEIMLEQATRMVKA